MFPSGKKALALINANAFFVSRENTEYMRFIKKYSLFLHLVKVKLK